MSRQTVNQAGSVAEALAIRVGSARAGYIDFIGDAALKGDEEPTLRTFSFGADAAPDNSALIRLLGCPRCSKMLRTPFNYLSFCMSNKEPPR